MLGNALQMRMIGINYSGNPSMINPQFPCPDLENYPSFFSKMNPENECISTWWALVSKYQQHLSLSCDEIRAIFDEIQPGEYLACVNHLTGAYF
jgi:hypothetical protein